MDVDALVRDVIDALRARGWTLASAESVTGGLFGATITRVPGASDVFHGGVISYVDGVKAALLGVDAKMLEERGAVRPEVAAQMAYGARGRLGTDIGLSFTGFAGPTAPGEQPVGRVFIGIAAMDGARVVEHTFDGDRDAIREAAVREGLRLVLKVVGKPDAPA